MAENTPLDLLLKGGHVIDPANNIDAPTGRRNQGRQDRPRGG